MTISSPAVLRWVLGLSFLAMAVWMLIPDKLDDADTEAPRFGVFGTTLIAFFLAEMGDKTQIATVALAARFDAFLPVVTGTTFGMMLANVPAVLVGDRLAAKLPVRLVHGVAALVFAVHGVLALVGASRLRYAWQRGLLVAAAVLLSGVVGLTRLYLGVHYFSDVVAGWCAGWALAIVFAAWARRGEPESYRFAHR